MKLVVQVKLLPTPEQVSALESTLRACNTAASEVARVARNRGVYRNYDLRKYVYQNIKDNHRLGAQAAQHVIKKVCDSYKALKANIRAGNLGRPGSKRRRRAETDPISFRWEAAQPYDARMLSWQRNARTVSIWTVAGRLKGVAYAGSPDGLKAVAELPVGESDLVHRDGMWFLHTTVEAAEPELVDPKGFLGIDMGIANIAYDSDGDRYAGTTLNSYRRRQLRLRQRLQRKDTNSARRLLARRRRKEARHAANVNHCIAKTIVTKAERTGRGIAVEDLTGIRERVRLRKPQRVTLSSWSFHQLGEFLTYKARRAGVPLVEVDPRYTSQTCHRCGHRDKRNRVDQETFNCRSCGVVAHADHNAALNIASRGVEAGAQSTARTRPDLAASEGGDLQTRPFTGG
ncbi:IS605 OrfB family transposase [Allocatelliglobosispora scoriae]|uniref:IS605 OrfB family transposase n=1 Tax=Allocatelliglobosispora scoriae TaxID=643052 RepID=A0A841BIS3_9ACTN|nr:RNA-guided endonuclease TnpB family protein [Allocatelliglobosispora scoriae]MBB5867096.1 IS605 OrfB family transposase [Allocatelliglobosispora scoriae]